MGSVLQFKPQENFDLDQVPSHPEVDEAYSKLEQANGFSHRFQQIQLSKDIYDAFTQGHPYVAEAPTGTGKTIAYLIGAILASKKIGVPIIVATGTVSLQNQIIKKDVPDLAKAGLLSLNEVSIAKGRARYFCPRIAAKWIESSSGEAQADLFSDTAVQSAEDFEMSKDLFLKWENNTWSGDIDSWKGKKVKIWENLCANADSCIARACPDFGSCPYFKDRKMLGYANIIIANHDMVLSDLNMRAAGLDGVFPFTNYLLVVDEAHHLPDKTISNTVAQYNLSAAKDWVSLIPNFAGEIAKRSRLLNLLQRRRVDLMDLEVDEILDHLDRVITQISLIGVDEVRKWHRFRKGQVPAELSGAILGLAGRVTRLSLGLSRLANALKNISTLKEIEPILDYVNALMVQVSPFYDQCKKLEKALLDFTGNNERVRWTQIIKGKVSIHSSLTEGAEELNRLLWTNHRVRSVFVSATLKALGSFDRFKAKAGLPEKTVFRDLPSVFDYSKSTIVLPRTQYSPSDDGFLNETIDQLSTHIDRSEGTLILFNALGMMNKIHDTLPVFLKEMALVQYSKAPYELVSEHIAKISQGQGSILMGVQSFAEGLDLPGRNCEHVIIVRLPFSMFDNPIDDERQELLAEKYFSEHALPDATIRLIQMAGRLIRRENDGGRVTILDRRIWSTNYGRKMIESLPDFKRLML